MAFHQFPLVTVHRQHQSSIPIVHAAKRYTRNDQLKQPNTVPLALRRNARLQLRKWVRIHPAKITTRGYLRGERKGSTRSFGGVSAEPYQLSNISSLQGERLCGRMPSPALTRFRCWSVSSLIVNLAKFSRFSIAGVRMELRSSFATSVLLSSLAAVTRRFFEPILDVVGRTSSTKLAETSGRLPLLRQIATGSSLSFNTSAMLCPGGGSPEVLKKKRNPTSCRTK